jgi:hypothetical protein
MTCPRHLPTSPTPRLLDQSLKADCSTSAERTGLEQAFCLSCHRSSSLRVIGNARVLRHAMPNPCRCAATNVDGRQPQPSAGWAERSQTPPRSAMRAQRRSVVRRRSPYEIHKSRRKPFFFVRLDVQRTLCRHAPQPRPLPVPGERGPARRPTIRRLFRRRSLSVKPGSCRGRRPTIESPVSERHLRERSSSGTRLESVPKTSWRR